MTRAALPGGDCRGRAGAADSPLPGAGRARAQPGTPRHVTAWAGAPRETGRPGMGGGGTEKIGKGGLGWDAKWHRFGRDGSNRSHVTELQSPAQAVGPAQVLQYRCIHPPTHRVEGWPVFESPARDPWPRGSGLSCSFRRQLLPGQTQWGGPTISCSSLSQEQWPALASSPDLSLLRKGGCARAEDS